MRKAIAVFAVLLAAGLAQASTINWNGTALDESSNPIIAGQAYLVYCGSGDTTAEATWDGTQWVMGDDVVVASAAYGTSSTLMGYFSQSTTGIGTPANTSYYYVIVTSAGAPGTTLPTTEGSFYGISDAVKQTKDGVTGTESMGFGNVVADTEIVPIPEPSTVALALVGVAAVALRRKFMKK